MNTNVTFSAKVVALVSNALIIFGTLFASDGINLQYGPAFIHTIADIVINLGIIWYMLLMLAGILMAVMVFAVPFEETYEKLKKDGKLEQAWKNAQIKVGWLTYGLITQAFLVAAGFFGMFFMGAIGMIGGHIWRMETKKNLSEKLGFADVNKNPLDD